MKKAIGIGIAIMTLLFIVGCKPTAKDLTAGLDLSTDVANLKTDMQDMMNQISDLQAALDDVTTNLDSLSVAFTDHMKKFHSTTTTIYKPKPKPATGGTPRRHVK
jgi:outer membrane murein-binding lipoprotein Lpp